MFQTQNSSVSHGTNRQLVSPLITCLVGAVLSLAVGLPLAYWGVEELVHAIGQLVWVLVAVYIAALTAYYWVSGKYHNGLSIKEMLYTLVWPVDVVREYRRGNVSTTDKLQTLGTTYRSDDNGPKISQTAAFIVGLILSATAGALVVVGIVAALHTIGSLVWLVIITYILGAIVTFWFAQPWNSGLTPEVLKKSATWPAKAMQRIGAGISRLRSRLATTP